jgi:uncharacterized protein (DUF58 family)
MFRSLRPHVPGLLYTGALALVAVAAMNNQNNLLFWVLGVLAAGLVVSAIISNLTIRALRIRRIDPQHGSVGEPLNVRYAVTNRGRLLSAFNLYVQDALPRESRDILLRPQDRNSPPRAWVMHVGTRETVHGEAIFWPTRRGKVTFDRVLVWSTFPFGIIRKSRAVVHPQHTLIYPMLYELRRGLLQSITPKSLLGTKVSHHTGAGDDYYGMREYKPGDSMRHIAWKRTARTDQLVTIERTSPSPAKLRVILDVTDYGSRHQGTKASRNQGVDASNPKGSEGDMRDLEERAISLAASIVHEADVQGYEIGLTILGLPVTPIPLRRNRWHFNKIMAALAEIDLNVPRVGAQPQPIRDAERAALVVISPDRIHTLPGREDAWYLTARQLESLAVRPIGWDAARQPRPKDPSPQISETSKSSREAAA